MYSVRPREAGEIAGLEVLKIVIEPTAPYTFGTESLGEVDGMPSPYQFVPLIKKNTPISVQTSEVLYTLHPEQEAVMVTVFQGEHQDARKNIKLGKFVVHGIS